MDCRRPTQLLADLFEATSVNYSSNEAVVLENGEALTYSELDKRASKIQDLLYETLTNTSTVKLIDQLTNNTSLVTVMMGRSFAFVVAMLGILKAGAAYVPVDPSFPPERQRYIFSHSKCWVLIVDEESFDSAVALGVELPQLIKVDSNGNIIEVTIPNIIHAITDSHDDIKAFRRNNADNRLAYVLYTSGSTGKPKGVMVKNVGVVNIINWFADELKVSPNSRVLGLTTFCFDISVLEMFVPLTRGATLVLAESSTQKDPFTLVELMERQRISVFQATPTTYEMLLATGWTGDSGIDFLVTIT